jgi:hypothetical protein
VLTATVVSLHAESAEFRRLRAEHHVADWSTVTIPLHHPHAGAMETAIDLMRSAGPPDQWLATFNLAPGSPSHAVLLRLRSDRTAPSPVRQDSPDRSDNRRELTFLLCTALPCAAALEWDEQGDVWARVRHRRPATPSHRPHRPERQQRRQRL